MKTAILIEMAEMRIIIPGKGSFLTVINSFFESPAVLNIHYQFVTYTSKHPS